MTTVYEQILINIRTNKALSARLNLMGYDINRLEELDLDELLYACEDAQRLNGDWEDDD